MARHGNQIVDEALVLACQAGDDAGFGPLVRRWHPRLLETLIRATGRAEVGQDLAQDVWLTVVKDLGRLDDPAAFPGWLMRIAQRRAADWVRRQARQRKLMAGAQHAAVASSFSLDASVSSGLVAEERSTLVRAALGLLSPGHRDVVVRHYLEGQTAQDIAAALGLPVGTIKSRLHYARRRMSESLFLERNV
ncbi:MAG: sigma-70 family RNA polymerase sigma factor [Planctomycetota bacterium]